MSDKSYRDRIPSADLTAYERWELPLLDDQGNEIAPSSREEEMDVKPLTAADLERIHKEAWDEGHRDGQTEGYNKGYKDGHEAGHKEGFAKGEAEGLEAGKTRALEETQQQVEAGLNRLDMVMGELLDPIERQRDEVESALVNLATALTRVILHRELKIDSSQIRQVVAQALDTLPSPADNVRIRVHPSDRQWVEDVAERFEAQTRITEDDSLMPGGCLVETHHSLVDFTVEKRFQKTLQTMLDRQLSQSETLEGSELDALMGELTDMHRELLDDPSPTSDPENGEHDGER